MTDRFILMMIQCGGQHYLLVLQDQLHWKLSFLC